MTRYRKELLDTVIHTEGFESPLTITIFKLNELHPEEEFDLYLHDTYNAIKETIVKCQVAELVEELLDEAPLPPEQEDDESYNPFIGQSDFWDFWEDCFGE